MSDVSGCSMAFDVLSRSAADVAEKQKELQSPGGETVPFISIVFVWAPPGQGTQSSWTEPCNLKSAFPLSVL